MRQMPVTTEADVPVLTRHGLILHHHLLAMTTSVRLVCHQVKVGATMSYYADDPPWDGQGCGPTSTCCTFNNPPWFCKQLPQSTNVDLEVRLCSLQDASLENTPIELVEIYVK